MKFTKLRVYDLHESATIPHDLSDRLAEHCFRECTATEQSSFGFVPPSPEPDHTLFTQSGVVICFKRQEKVIPPAEIDKRLNAAASEQGRPLSRKERQVFKDDITATLLPQAFSRFEHIYAIIQPRRIIVLTNNANKAESVLGILRSAIGSLPVRPWCVGHAAEYMFTDWLMTEKLPQGYTLGESCKLQDPDRSGEVKIKNDDLTRDEIKAHLLCGKMCTELELYHEELGSFTLRSDFSITGFEPVEPEHYEPVDDATEILIAEVEFVTPLIERIINDINGSVASDAE